MPEEETIFSSKIKYKGIFSFKDFYKFCYDWLAEESGLKVQESKYDEKLSADSKDIDIAWSCSKEVTDYFKFKVSVSFKVGQLKEIETIQGGAKIKTNQGGVEVGIKGTLQRDYKGKFERSAFQKFMRSVYEKWIIASRVGEFEDKLASTCDGFLGQAKAWLDLEGQK